MSIATLLFCRQEAEHPLPVAFVVNSEVNFPTRIVIEFVFDDNGHSFPVRDKKKVKTNSGNRPTPRTAGMAAEPEAGQGGMALS
jgi:hypothetical protein